MTELFGQQQSFGCLQTVSIYKGVSGTVARRVYEIIHYALDNCLIWDQLREYPELLCAIRGGCGSGCRAVILQLGEWRCHSWLLQSTCRCALGQDTYPQIAPVAAPTMYEWELMVKFPPDEQVGILWKRTYSEWHTLSLTNYAIIFLFIYCTNALCSHIHILYLWTKCHLIYIVWCTVVVLYVPCKVTLSDLKGTFK